VVVPAAAAASEVVPPTIPWSEIVQPVGAASTVPPPPGALSSAGPDVPVTPADADVPDPTVVMAAVGTNGTALVETSSDAVVGEVVLDSLDVTPPTVVDVVLALGANLGAAQETLRAAVDMLSHTTGLEVVQVSPLARTTAVGGPDEQPDYLNAIVLARTMFSPRELLRVTQRIENAHGRVREERWGPRTLDIDIIVYGSVLAVTDDLELPHPRAHERAFVLEPWAQVDPDAVLPGLGGGPVAALAATAPDREGIRWLALDWLSAPPAAAPTADGSTDDDGSDDGATERWEAPQT
jgi:dihydroneopterin aldolase/2-amino-4-hydroxy-6-hydroxymethyldihydropteridine diphosphokinase